MAYKKDNSKKRRKEKLIETVLECIEKRDFRLSSLMN